MIVLVLGLVLYGDELIAHELPLEFGRSYSSLPIRDS